MDTQTILQLNQLNQAFYATTATEFDKTRNHSWPGWEKSATQLPTKKIESVLDVGCGNGRFALFAEKNFPNLAKYMGIDSSDALLAAAPKQIRNLTPQYQQVDFISAPVVEFAQKKETFDLIVLFGVLHHIPGSELRTQLLAQLKKVLTPQGFLVFTTWQFMEFERFTRKIVQPDSIHIPPEVLEKNDFLLDWRRGERAIRYCHYFTQEEATDLIVSAHLQLVHTFRADGKEGNVNRYFIVQK